jgi:hypothetical protein
MLKTPPRRHKTLPRMPKRQTTMPTIPRKSKAMTIHLKEKAKTASIQSLEPSRQRTKVASLMPGLASPWS